eukprot:gene6936-11099_t
MEEEVPYQQNIKRKLLEIIEEEQEQTFEQLNELSLKKQKIEIQKVEEFNFEQLIEFSEEFKKTFKKYRDDYFLKVYFTMLGEFELFEHAGHHRAIKLCDNWLKYFDNDLVFKLTKAVCYFHLGHFEKCFCLLDVIGNSDGGHFLDDTLSKDIAKGILDHFTTVNVHSVHFSILRRIITEFLPSSIGRLYDANAPLRFRFSRSGSNSNVETNTSNDFSFKEAFRNIWVDLHENDESDEEYTHILPTYTEDDYDEDDFEYDEFEEVFPLVDEVSELLKPRFFELLEENPYYIFVIHNYQFKIYNFTVEEVKKLIEIFPPFFMVYCRCCLPPKKEILLHGVEHFPYGFYGLNLKDQMDAEIFEKAYKKDKRLTKYFLQLNKEFFSDLINKIDIPNVMKCQKYFNLNFKFEY